jgi:catalase (peroxidase I)
MRVAGNNKKDVEWAEAKKKCRLNEETLKMAQQMGLNPRSLIKNIPNKSEQWKAPVNVWIQEMYEKRQIKALKKKVQKEASPE